MGEDAAAHEEHGQRANDADAAHKPRHKQNNGFTGGGSSRAAHQGEAEIVGLHNHRHDAVHKYGEPDADQDQADDLGGERRAGHHAQGDDDDFGGEDEVGTDGAFDFGIFVDQFVGHAVGAAVAAVHQLVQQFFHAFKTQITTAEH